MVGSGVGSIVGVLVAVGVFVGVEVEVGIIVMFGVGVSVGNICTAPTHDERRSAANITIVPGIIKVLMVNPFNFTLWACASIALSITDFDVVGKL
jgi:hypothetical protein